MQPYSNNLPKNANEIVEFEGGMEGGCQFRLTNLQEGMTKEGICLIFCMRGHNQTLI